MFYFTNSYDVITIPHRSARIRPPQPESVHTRVKKKIGDDYGILNKQIKLIFFKLYITTNRPVKLYDGFRQVLRRSNFHRQEMHQEVGDYLFGGHQAQLTSSSELFAEESMRLLVAYISIYIYIYIYRP